MTVFTSLAVPTQAGEEAHPGRSGFMLLDDLGTLHRDTGTRVPGAQRYFDQGLRLAYGFNHEAAGRAFAQAARLDPQCAMCWWGRAR